MAVSLRMPKGAYITPTGEVFEARKLVVLGNSYVLVLPKPWVRVFAPYRWIELVPRPATGEFLIRPLAGQKLEVVLNEHRDH